jgi:thiol-disulfide isomerase/thioredoxin
MIAGAHRAAAVIVLLTALVAPASASFVMEDSEHRVLRLSDFSGRWVLVNFWATWCPPCLAEIPDLVALDEARKDIQIIGVAIDWKDRTQVLQFAEGMFVGYPIVLGERELAETFGDIEGLPTSLIYDPEGNLVTRHTGVLTRADIERIIGPAR